MLEQGGIFNNLCYESEGGLYFKSKQLHKSSEDCTPTLQDFEESQIYESTTWLLVMFC
jgi:hypothetical protein